MTESGGRLYYQTIGKNYSKFRPDYPQEIFDKIIEFMKKNGHTSFKTALDIACGAGEATKDL